MSIVVEYECDKLKTSWRMVVVAAKHHTEEYAA